MEPFEIVETAETLVSCDGDGDVGHPVVYLSLSPAGRALCPYCSRTFVNPAAAVPEAGKSGYSGVATPSAHGSGAADDEERPPPLQPPTVS